MNSIWITMVGNQPDEFSRQNHHPKPPGVPPMGSGPWPRTARPENLKALISSWRCDGIGIGRWEYLAFSMGKHTWLVVTGTWIIPTDALIFFRVVGIPPTRHIWEISRETCRETFDVSRWTFWLYNYPYWETGINPPTCFFSVPVIYKLYKF